MAIRIQDRARAHWVIYTFHGGGSEFHGTLKKGRISAGKDGLGE